MLRLENCFCWTIESASKIFSIFGILESLISIFFSIITVILFSTVQEIEKTIIWLEGLIHIKIETETSNQLASFVDSVVRCSYTNIVILVLELLAFICMARSVFCSKTELFTIPVLLMIPVSILKTVIISILMFTFFGWISLMAGIIWISVGVALWLVFYSYREELREEHSGEKWEPHFSCFKILNS